ncbi:MAG: hypothetical protein KDK91_31490, partial [Gammaproteobacteria bacterium]|nr:hypothetical protein [Gammaproteobacteria bacterium]
MLCTLRGVLDADALRSVDELVGEADFTDGATTAGFRARRVKRNEQASRSDAREAVIDRVLGALEAHPVFQVSALPRFIAPPLLSRYGPGMYYGAHVDDALMGADEVIRTDIAVTVFLSEPTSYVGGELVVASPYGETRVKLPRGDAV